MRLVVIGSRHFGAAALTHLLEAGHAIMQVIAPAEDDRLAVAASRANVPTTIVGGSRRITASDIRGEPDLIVAAHSHSFIAADALQAARLGGIGYHPSLLPRHRGKAAVEWTIRSGDAIAGGSVYQLTEHLDTGPIAAQDWCFVRPGETARALWERALSPMGLKLLTQVVNETAARGTLELHPQDETFATNAPP